MSTVRQLSTASKAFFVIAALLVSLLCYTIAKTADSIATPACKTIVGRAAQTDKVINDVR